MSISYNRFIGIGRLTRDPEIRFTPKGTQVTTFTIAIDRNYNDEADFIRVETFGRLAEIVGNYLTKGRLVLVEGELRIDKWQEDDGWHSVTKISASKVQFLETKRQADVLVDEPAVYAPEKKMEDKPEFFGAEPPEDDDIPF